MEKLLLIDGNSLINRAFYAMPILSTADGTPTNAVYGFMNMYFKLIAEEKPTFVAVAFDLKAPTFRHKMFSGYKATRKPMPEELRPQIPLLKKVLNQMGVATLEKEGVEADDIIGTLAKQTDFETIIVTGDRDSFQLVDNSTTVFFTKRGITDVQTLNAQNFLEQTGITPSQVIELKALMGDASDNIPGVAGVGEKTAKTLLTDYGTLDGVYQNIDKIKGKLQEKLIAEKDSAYLSRELATINTDCGIQYTLDGLRYPFPLSLEVKRLFIDLQFKSLLNKDGLFEQDSDQQSPDTDQKSPEKTVTYTKISDFSFLESIKESPAVCVNNNGLFVYEKGVEYHLPIAMTLLDEGVSLLDVYQALAKFLPTTRSIVFGKKDLRHELKNHLGFSPEFDADDLSIAKYLADFDASTQKLSEVILKYGLDEKHPAQAIDQIFQQLKDKLKAENTLDLYEKVELPLADVLYNMELSGFKVDAQSLNLAGEKYRERLALLEAQIRQLTDEPTLNVNSPKQLGEVLFDKLKIAKGKKTKTGYSTNAEILENLEDTHPSIPLILEFRRIQKLFSTYIEGFKPLIDKKTGLVHTSFNQTVTSTGRLSSKEPNLQNIPVRDEEGKELRKFFVPKSSERILVGADYSQIELRLLACFSNTQSLIDAFNNGEDVHRQTASKVFDVPISEVTSEMRSRAKAVNFGIIYGISEYGLAKTLKIPPFKAKDYITSYFKQYPEVKEYMNSNVQFAKTNGYATTLLNRRRYINELTSPSYQIRSFGERAAMNMPLQGSSADIIKLAMLRVYNRLKQEGLKSELILQIHDELIVDAFIDEQAKVEQILKEEMENVADLSVRLEVECGAGKSWYETK